MIAVLPTLRGVAVLEPGREQQIRDSIRRQTLLRTLGVEVAEVASGRVALDLPFRADLCQQNGYVHAGAVTAVADSACGYAALTQMPDSRDVLTVEFKVNLVSPARGERFRAVGTVVRSGRTLTVCSAEVTSHGAAGEPRLVALMQATMIAITPPPAG
jgi:uncharacterized protein (TIGR00369 family)